MQKLWREKNAHNFTTCVNASKFPVEKVTVGNYTYGPLMVISFSRFDGSLRIGHFCSIADNVRFLLGGEHKHNYLSTYPFKAKFWKENESLSKGDIVVEDDVWIGHSALILSGVTLARGTIVAAGSVVVKSTEPYSIVGGNPAKLIKKRFSDETIEKLMKINFEEWDKVYIEKHIEELYQELV